MDVNFRNTLVSLELILLNKFGEPSDAIVGKGKVQLCSDGLI